MDCSEFLDAYSDYRDGVVTEPGLLLRLRKHLQTCRHCARYDRLIRKGVVALRKHAEIEPSPEFARRLKQRLAAGGPASALLPITPPGSRVAAAVMIAAAVVFLVYEGLRGPEQPRRTASTLPSEPMPLVVANPGLPFVTFNDLNAPAIYPAQSGRIRAQDSALALVTWANLPR